MHVDIVSKNSKPYTVGSTVSNEVNRVMRHSPPSQTKANPNLTMVPLITITYTSAQLHESTIKCETESIHAKFRKIGLIVQQILIFFVKGFALFGMKFKITSLMIEMQLKLKNFYMWCPMAQNVHQIPNNPADYFTAKFITQYFSSCCSNLTFQILLVKDKV